MSCLSEGFLSEITEKASESFLLEVFLPKVFGPKVFDFNVIECTQRNESILQKVDLFV